MNTHERYPAAIPVLLQHIEQPYPDAIREGIARALATPDALPHWKTLIRLFEGEPASRTQHGLAVALSVLCSRSTAGDVMNLIRDTKYGESRVFFVKALRRLRLPEANQVVESLKDDADVSREIARLSRAAERRKAK